MYFKYISVLREKYRYKVLRYLGCILSTLKNINEGSAWNMHAG